MKKTTDRRRINGAWVKALRKGLGLTQEAMAQALGVARPTVARWETNAFRPTKLAAMALQGLAATHRAKGKRP